MPAKLIICCAGRPAVNGHKRRSFIWSDAHGCYVYESRELDEATFNSIAQEVMSKNQDMRCFAKVIGAGEAGADPRVADLERKLAEKQARLETVQASLIAARSATEPTLEQAIALIEAQAPERLKKKPGRKLEALEV